MKRALLGEAPDPPAQPVPGRLLTLRIYYLASFAALGTSAPYLPRWLEARGVEGLSMGLVTGLIPAMGVLGPPAVGLVADALGLRGALIRVACLGSCLTMGALAAGAAGGVLSFGAIFALILLFGVFRSPMVMLADVIALERARAAGTDYGKLRLWGSVGFLGGVVTAGRAIDPRAGPTLPATIAGLLLVAFFAAFWLPGRPAVRGLPVAREARALLSAPDFATFLAVAVLAQLAHVSYDLCFSLHLRDLGATGTAIGFVWATGVAFEVALMVFAERVVARFSAPRLLAFALAGAAARWALLSVVRSLPVLLALQPLHAISFGVWWVASVAYAKARAPAHALATAQGLFAAAAAVGAVTGNVVWSALYHRAGGGVVFAAASATALLAAAIAAAWVRRARVTTALATPS
jgi:MFS transporter, PPP family, 3-phenylpropionic acid transporter